VKSKQKWERDDEAIQTLVFLHGVYEPSLDQIGELNDADAQAVEHYCVKAHLRASDNIVRVPSMPEVMKLWPLEE
jgi:hypothetical protein